MRSHIKTGCFVVWFLKPKLHYKRERLTQVTNHFQLMKILPLKLFFYRLFRLRLQESSGNIFSPDVSFENTAGKIVYNTEKIFSGYMEDDEHATVDGIFTADGSFDGHIQTRDQLFYVEPSKRYKKNFLHPSVIDHLKSSLSFSFGNCRTRYFIGLFQIRFSRLLSTR